MWCTRWFLPLLLLPLPTASPYFLILFLVSLTLHARPCFYCIILLTALFTSSCYWQPVPTEVILKSIYPHVSIPEALLYALNTTTNIDVTDITNVPKLTSVNDRCWCDLSGTGLFEPFNTTQWQLNSLARTIGVSDASSENVEDDYKNEPTKTTVVVQDSKALDSNKHWITSILSSSVRTLPPSEFLNKWPFTAFKTGNTTHNASTSNPTRISEETSDVDTDTIVQDPTPVLRTKSRILGSTYDLRPYGINLIIDFSWPRNPLNAPAFENLD